MGLCDRNLSVGIFTGFDTSFVKIEGDRVTGKVGALFDRFLRPTKQRNCRFINVHNTLSSKHLAVEKENLSAIHLMRKNLLDFFPIPTDPSFTDEAVEATKPIHSFSYRLGQLFPETNAEDKLEKSDLLSFLFDNVRLLVMILLGGVFITVVTSIVLTIIHKDYRKFKNLKQTLLNAYFIDSKPLLSLSLKFAVLLLSFELFMFFNKNFLGAGIKTSKVVVNTDEVVDSIFKLIHTQKTLGIIYQDNFLKNAPEASLAHKLSKKKVHIIGLQAGKEAAAIVKSLPSFCFLSTEVSLFFIFSLIVQLSNPKKLVVFSETKSYHEVVNSFLIRRGLDDERKRFIHSRTESSFEKGLVSNWYGSMSEVLLSSIRQHAEIVTTTQEYVDHCSSNVPLEVDLDNLVNILGLFFGFQSSILMVATVIQKRSLLFDLVTKIISQIKNLFALIIKFVLDVMSLFAACSLKIKRACSKIYDLFRGWFSSAKGSGVKQNDNSDAQ